MKEVLVVRPLEHHLLVLKFVGCVCVKVPIVLMAPARMLIEIRVALNEAATVILDLWRYLYRIKVSIRQKERNVRNRPATAINAHALLPLP